MITKTLRTRHFSTATKQKTVLHRRRLKYLL